MLQHIRTVKPIKLLDSNNKIIRDYPYMKDTKTPIYSSNGTQNIIPNISLKDIDINERMSITSSSIKKNNFKESSIYKCTLAYKDIQNNSLKKSMTIYSQLINDILYITNEDIDVTIQISEGSVYITVLKNNTLNVIYNGEVQFVPQEYIVLQDFEMFQQLPRRITKQEKLLNFGLKKYTTNKKVYSTQVHGLYYTNHTSPGYTSSQYYCSTDGISWSRCTNIQRLPIYFNNLWLSGNYYSRDGKYFTKSSDYFFLPEDLLPINNCLLAIVEDTSLNSNYTASTISSRVLKSTDGKTWSQKFYRHGVYTYGNSGSPGSIQFMTPGNMLYIGHVGCRNCGTGYTPPTTAFLQYSTDNGDTWNEISINDRLITEIEYYAEKDIYLFWGSENLYYSKDGITWAKTNIQVPPDMNIGWDVTIYKNPIIKNGKLAVLVDHRQSSLSYGDTTNVLDVYTSNDGITWTKAPIPPNYYYTALNLVNDYIVLTGRNYGNCKSYYSKDVVSWKEIGNSITSNCNVTYCTGKYFIYDFDTKKSYLTKDFNTFTKVNIPSTINYYSGIWYNNNSYSLDLETWIPLELYLQGINNTEWTLEGTYEDPRCIVMKQEISAEQL